MSQWHFKGIPIQVIIYYHVDQNHSNPQTLNKNSEVKTNQQRISEKKSHFVVLDIMEFLIRFF